MRRLTRPLVHRPSSWKPRSRNCSGFTSWAALRTRRSRARTRARRAAPSACARCSSDPGPRAHCHRPRLQPRYRRRRLLQRHDRPVSERRDDVHLQTDELGRQFRQSLEARFRRPRLIDEVLPLDVAEIPEAMPKRFQVFRGGGVRVSEMADAPELRRLLRIAASGTVKMLRARAAASATVVRITAAPPRRYPRRPTSSTNALSSRALPEPGAVVAVARSLRRPSASPARPRRARTPCRGPRRCARPAAARA